MMVAQKIKAVSPRDVVEMYPVFVSTSNLARLRCNKRGPIFYRVGKKIIYKVEDVEAYLYAQPVLTRDSVEIAPATAR